MVPFFDEAGAALVLPAVPVLLRVEDVLSGRGRVLVDHEWEDCVDC